MNTNAAVKMEKISYGGWSNCIQLSNNDIDLVATTDVGPRIIRFGFKGGLNLMKEFPDHMGKTGGGKWRSFGGHRLWHAPEVSPRSYAPDNTTVKHGWDGKKLTLTPDTEASTGIQKQIEVILHDGENRVTVVHRLINRGQWEIEIAPWALTVMEGPGRAIFPQEPAVQQLLPVRPLVLWGYTNMKDPRWTWGTKYVQVKCDPAADTAQKFGCMNTLGWGAYQREDVLFIKRFPFDANATYPDFGCNTECYTRGGMLEVESVGALAKLAPGASVEHVEHWYLFKAKIGEDEKEIDGKLLPLVSKTEPVK